MIGGVVLLIGILFIWIGGTDRGNAMWQAITGMEFKGFGFS
jgi:hypothetical protein